MKTFRTRIVSSLTFVMFLASLPLFGQQKISDELQKKVDFIFQEWDKPTTPGGIIGVIKDGDLIYTKGYGMANLEYNIPIFNKTVFRVASISKQFTAACILMLEEQNKLSLDDKLSDYFEGFPAYADQIQVKHLLYHTSGLRDFFKLAMLSGYNEQDRFTSEEVLEMIKRQKNLNFEPGTDMLYNNSGYFLLGEIVKKVAGEGIGVFAQKNIFDPLKMFNTHFHDNHKMIVRNRASGYASGENGGFEIYMSNLSIIGDGGLFTTVEDLAKWDWNFYYNRLPITNFTQKMQEKGRLSNGEKLSYAAGLDHGEHRSIKTVGHSGAFVGFRSQLLRFPELNMTVICLSNVSSLPATKLAYQVADVMLDSLNIESQLSLEVLEVESRNPKLKLELQELVGNYELANGMVVKLFTEKGEFYIDFLGQIKMQLFAKSKSEFFAKEIDLSLAFIPSKEKGGSSFWLSLNGKKIFAEKAASQYGVDLNEFVGTYYSDELNAYYSISRVGDKLFLKVGNKLKTPFSMIKIDKWAMEDGLASFHRNAEGAITSFEVKAGPIRKLHFIKQVENYSTALGIRRF
ncbi:serine hydrolase domain-containing protein [Flammeovirgaceae bacterium SG7u.111]|nr:serine hydrolase domain-containing protein [Flammeovirgaceae bacterium SG7u.132]WPO35340.1 serine hydrolase domain-containing protein [Flammeovirgaceae bacterium SG7u.111]